MVRLVQLVSMLSILMVARSDSKVVDLSAETFDDALKDRGVFVKFYSPNCPHCQRLSPIWEKVAVSSFSHPQSFVVADVDCNAESFLCERFSIRGVPTLLFFKDGKMYKFSGKREYNDIMKFGAGDYVSAAESGDIPAAGGLGIVGKTAYSLQKFIKDLLAMVRFNYMAVLFLLLIGAALGSLVTFAVMVASISKEVQSLRDRASKEAPEGEVTDGPAAEEKSLESKKVD